MEWFYDMLKILGIPVTLLIGALITGAKSKPSWYFAVAVDQIKEGYERVITEKNAQLAAKDKQLLDMVEADKQDAAATEELTKLVRETHAAMRQQLAENRRKAKEAAGGKG